MVEKMGGVQFNSYMPYAFYQVVINSKKPAFASPTARYALSAAVDRKALLPGVTDRNDLTIVNDGAFPSDLFSRNFAEYNVPPFKATQPYDQAAAVSMAEKSGLKGQTAVLLFPDSLGDLGQKMADSLVA